MANFILFLYTKLFVHHHFIRAQPCLRVIPRKNPFLFICFQWTALHLAADEGCHEVVRFLLTKGAEIVFDMDKNSFISLAIRKRHMDVGRVVIAHARLVT